ncbi:MAG: WYL domain-containing protein [Oligoflexales bacterium]|nr:WYL domain-containing protein [Oligoflexales bacterium]
MSKYVIIDLETTGLFPLSDEAVEIGAVLAKDGEVLGRFHALLRTAVKVSEGAFRAHRLSNDDLNKLGEEPEKAWKKLKTFIEEYPLIAHNGLSFDFHFIFNAFTRYGIDPGANKLIDSIPVFSELTKNQYRSYSLPNLCRQYKVVNAAAHRAEGDVEALHQLFKIIVGKKPGITRLWEMCGAYKFHSMEEILRDLPKGFELLQQAMENELEICIEYTKVNEAPEVRWIKPMVIQLAYGNQYVQAFCYLRNELRTFRLSRISKMMELREGSSDE